jgi:hypothetical protein
MTSVTDIVNDYLIQYVPELSKDGFKINLHRSCDKVVFICQDPSTNLSTFISYLICKVDENYFKYGIQIPLLINPLDIILAARDEFVEFLKQNKAPKANMDGGDLGLADFKSY